MRKRNRHSKPNHPVVDSQTIALAVGDCIVVKPGVKDPDSGTDIAGWQGRVTEIQSYQPSKLTVTFQWDSLSLKRMPASAIRRCEEKGLDWTSMGLYPEEIERAEPRDTQADVDALIGELSAEHSWDYLGKQGQRIHQVLAAIDKDNEMKAFKAWQKYLETHLKLPFEAIVSESQGRGLLHFGDRVTVTGFEGAEDMYGILVDIKAGDNAFVFPLCDLKAANQKSTHYTLTDDYAVWFSNR
jgi:hypothetical protein